MSQFSWDKDENNESNLMRFLSFLIQTIENPNTDMKSILSELRTNRDRAEEHKS